jgi:AraC family transcriptional activator FtrA
LRFFAAVEEALAFLERPELPSVLDEVAAITDGIRAISPLIRVLSLYFDRSLRDASIAQGARACGLSTRTLQRQLAELGTRFSDELIGARVRAARVMLEHSDEKIEVIAMQVGFGSSSRLSAAFRRLTGQTPAAYRQLPR